MTQTRNSIDSVQLVKWLLTSAPDWHLEKLAFDETTDTQWR